MASTDFVPLDKLIVQFLILFSEGPVKLKQRVKIVDSFLVCVKTVPLYHFELVYVVLHTAVKEVLETHFLK